MVALMVLYWVVMKVELMVYYLVVMLVEYLGLSLESKMEKKKGIEKVAMMD